MCASSGPRGWCVLGLCLVAACKFPALVEPPPADAQSDAQDASVDALPDVPTAWSRTSVGNELSCAIDTANRLFCWGSNVDGKLGIPNVGIEVLPRQVAAERTWREVATSTSSHACAIDTAGQLWCWGANANGQLGDGTIDPRTAPVLVDDGEWKQVSAGQLHTCGIKQDGTIWCWGSNLAGELGDGSTQSSRRPKQIGSGTTWSTVAAGTNVTCALKQDHTAWCWGNNGFGQLGDAPMPHDEPAQLGGDDWIAIDIRAMTTCGIRGTTAGELWCWGQNRFGERGDTSTSASGTPMRVGTASDWVEVKLGMTHGCAVSSSRAVACWGSNELGAMGDTVQEQFLGLRDVDVDAAEHGLSAGSGTCVIDTTQRLLCSGHNSTGQLGNGTGPSSSPSQVGTAADWLSITSSPHAGFSCGTRSPAAVSCWGANLDGQLGNNTPNPRRVPEAIFGAIPMSTVSAGTSYACGIRTSNSTLMCWGSNAYNQFGVSGSPPASSRQPIAATDGRAWMKVATGLGHTCAIAADGALWCWGTNLTGQVGVGSMVEQPLPVQVGQETTWASVTATHQVTCGIRTDGSLWCWGRNNAGQVGNGMLSSQLVPAQIGAALDWESVQTSGTHTCAVSTGGELHCWGLNDVGQLGDGTTVSQSSPLRVGTRADWKAVALGTSSTCALDDDGKLWCVGTNADGRFGNGTFASLATLTEVTPGFTWTAIIGSARHMCGIRSDQTLWCWGANLNGALGNGQGWRDAFAPVGDSN